MSEKITGKDLEKLLEKANFGTPPMGKVNSINVEPADIGFSSKGPAQKSIKRLASLDKNPGKISPKDLEIAYRSISGGKIDVAKKTALLLKGLTKRGDAAAQRKHDVNLYFSATRRTRSGVEYFKDYFFDEKYIQEPPSQEEIDKYLIVWDSSKEDIEPEAGELEVGRQTKQDLFDFDLRNYAAAEGSYPPQLASVFEALFQGETNFIKRLKKIIEYSNDTISLLSTGDQSEQAAQRLREMGLKKYMQNLMALDYLSSLVKNLETGSGAYQFETFLALLAGGKVTGKVTDGGLMGAMDFEMANGTKGSSKFYSKYSALSQSAKGFEEGQPVHYIIGIKKGEKQSEESDPTKIVELNIHWLIVKCIEKRGDEARFQYFDPQGVSMSIDSKFQQEASFGSKPFANNSFIGTIKLVSTETKTFAETAQAAASKLQNNFSGVLEKTKESVGNSIKVKEGITGYASTGRQESGQQAVDAIVALKSSALELISILKDIEGYEDVETSSITESQKITAEQLQKIIEETFNK